MNDLPPEKYPITAEAAASLSNSFTYHGPTPDQLPRYTTLREMGGILCGRILAYAPPCRERSLAITKVEEAIMWANKAIACNEEAVSPIFQPPTIVP